MKYWKTLRLRLVKTCSITGIIAKRSKDEETINGRRASKSRWWRLKWWMMKRGSSWPAAAAASRHVLCVHLESINLPAPSVLASAAVPRDCGTPIALSADSNATLTDWLLSNFCAERLEAVLEPSTNDDSVLLFPSGSSFCEDQWIFKQI